MRDLSVSGLPVAEYSQIQVRREAQAREDSLALAHGNFLVVWSLVCGLVFGMAVLAAQ